MGDTKQWSVYILRCSNNCYYCGVSNDLDRRVVVHNQGKGSKYTARNRPVKLVWFRLMDSNSTARAFECKIKRWNRAKKEKLMQGQIYE